MPLFQISLLLVDYHPNKQNRNETKRVLKGGNENMRKPETQTPKQTTHRHLPIWCPPCCETTKECRAGLSPDRRRTPSDPSRIPSLQQIIVVDTMPPVVLVGRSKSAQDQGTRPPICGQESTQIPSELTSHSILQTSMHHLLVSTILMIGGVN